MRFFPLVKNTSASLRQCRKYESHCYFLVWSWTMGLQCKYAHKLTHHQREWEHSPRLLPRQQWRIVCARREAVVCGHWGNISWSQIWLAFQLNKSSKQSVWKWNTSASVVLCCGGTLPIKWSLTVQVRSQCPTLSAIISAVVLEPGERLTVSVWRLCAVRIWPWKWTEWLSTLFKRITKKRREIK